MNIALFLKHVSLSILGFLLILIALIVLAVIWMSAMPGNATPSLNTLSDKSLVERLESHVKALAFERNVRHVQALDRAAAYIEDELKSYGYEVTSQWFDTEGVRVRNLVAVVPAKPGSADTSLVVVGAHYDSARGTPGADDNASGVAGLLEIARAMKAGNAPHDKEIRLVFFTNEEPPYFRTHFMGSYRYADMLVRERRPVAAMLSLEMLGYFCDEPGCQRYPFPLSLAFPDRGNFIGFVGNIASRELTRKIVKSFRSHASIASEGISAPAFIPGVDFSDQQWFWAFGFPAVMVTDTSFMRYAHYHRSTDTPEKLDYRRMSQVVEALKRTIADLAS